MKNLYIFSGLGADKRAFQKIDFSDYNTKFIEWIEPNVDENINEYALRIANQIGSKKPTIIGLSFGGIIATEIAKIIETEKIILIASAKTKFEIPKIYKLIGYLKIDKIIPGKLLIIPNLILDWAFGIENNTDKLLLSEIIRDTNPKFLKWAIRQILTWNNIQTPLNTIHIHGTKDRILPYKNIQNANKIENGGHFMTIDKSEQLTKLLKQII